MHILYMEHLGYYEATVKFDETQAADEKQPNMSTERGTM